MSCPDELTVTHPVFGELRWESDRETWATQIRDATGEWIDVSVAAEEGDLQPWLDRAADLYSRAVQAERQLLRFAVETELLELFNSAWRQADEAELSADGLSSRLTFAYIYLCQDSPVAVTMSYDDDDLFGGHAVDLELDSDLQLVDVNLVG